jgi:hypothetical protein
MLTIFGFQLTRCDSWAVPSLCYLLLLLTRCRLMAPRPAGTSLRSCPNCLQAFSSFVEIFSTQEVTEETEKLRAELSIS